MSVQCPDCGAIAGYGHELGHQSGCPAHSRKPGLKPVSAPDVKRHPGPWIGPDAELARACAMAAIKDYGTDDPDTHQRILKDGIWNDHVAVQAALAAIHHINSTAASLAVSRAMPRQQLDFLAGEVRKALRCFDLMPMPQYFEKVESGDPIALAVLGAFDHLSPALNVLGLTDEPLSDTQRPEGPQ